MCPSALLRTCKKSNQSIRTSGTPDSEVDSIVYYQHKPLAEHGISPKKKKYLAASGYCYTLSQRSPNLEHRGLCPNSVFNRRQPTHTLNWRPKLSHLPAPHLPAVPLLRAVYGLYYPEGPSKSGALKTGGLRDPMRAEGLSLGGPRPSYGGF